MLCPHCGESFAYDPHGLVRAGTPVAPLSQLAKIVDCSAKLLKSLLNGPLYKQVRFVRPPTGPWLYCISDVAAALEPHREAIATQRARQAELEAEIAQAARDKKLQPAPRPRKTVREMAPVVRRKPGKAYP